MKVGWAQHLGFLGFATANLNILVIFYDFEKFMIYFSVYSTRPFCNFLENGTLLGVRISIHMLVWTYSYNLSKMDTILVDFYPPAFPLKIQKKIILYIQGIRPWGPHFTRAFTPSIRTLKMLNRFENILKVWCTLIIVVFCWFYKNVEFSEIKSPNFIKWFYCMFENLLNQTLRKFLLCGKIRENRNFHAEIQSYFKIILNPYS